MTDLALTKLQTLLRTLFQFDAADLNFGIYRVLNYKRAEIEAFIDVRLPQIADEAFARYAAADRSKLEDRLQELRQSLKGGVDEEGNLKAPFDQLDMGKEYLDVQRQVAALSVADELKVRVYNDLYTFFNRYYEDGDFISKRRRGRDETYAVPYNGEEVLLHWANRDQYYIKTDERLAAYRFHAGEFHVAFEVRAAETTTNNNKSESRFYVLAPDPVAWDGDANLLTVAFHHRALTESEAITFGKTGQQDKTNAQSAETVLAAVSDTTLKGLLGRVPPGSDRSALLKHLGQFTRRNTLDFFIHKDLKGFLTRELDHFIKTEALRLDDLLADNADALPTQVQRARATRHVALSLIDLLAQVENFQKRLFEKKKFVLRTDYCLTLDRVPEDFWPEVLANEAQKADWQALYAVDEIMAKDGILNTGMSADFLRAHPSLMIDTRYFSDEFKWRLVSLLDDLDAKTDGLLVNSENFQALNLLAGRYEGEIRCIYVDPPYNTGGDGFLYKDSFKHSSWLTMLDDRLNLGKDLMKDSGVAFVSINDIEAAELSLLMDSVFNQENFLANMVWHNSSRSSEYVATEHEYIIAYAKQLPAIGTAWRRPREEAIHIKNVVTKAREGGKTLEDAISLLRESINGYLNEDKARGTRKHTWLTNYANIGQDWRIYYAVDLSGEGSGPPRTFGDKEVNAPPGRHWMSQEYIDLLYRDGRIVWRGDRAYRKLYIEETEETLKGLLNFPTRNGGELLKDLFGEDVFSKPKSVELLRHIFQFAIKEGETILDFFAGSGTTGNAIINLNREDGEKRKYVLVEMGGYFDAVLLPRIKKVVYCSDWADGRPVSGGGISQTIKYHTLEQYEDALNNLDVQRRATEGHQATLKFGDEYLLRYMLDFETQGSASLLDLDALADPFKYNLYIKQGDNVKPTPHPVDLVETFNYLLGLTVTRLRAFDDGGRVYRAVLGEKDGRRVAVVWRKASDLAATEEALARDRTFITDTLLPSLLGVGVTQDRLYVNSPCAVTGAEAVEPEFKRLMFGEAL